jgi:hypothetical protein
LNLHEQLPFFVYGTLCHGFRNHDVYIKVHAAHACSGRGSTPTLTPPAALGPASSARVPLRLRCRRLPRRALPAFGGGDVARREVLGELVDASHLSRKHYTQLLQNVGGISRAITMALCALLSLDCSWMVLRGSEGRIIRTTCTSTAPLPVVLFFTTLSCTSESAAKSAHRPLQAARALQPWRFGRMNTAGPSPAQTSGGCQVPHATEEHFGGRGSKHLHLHFRFY